jgi:hypothetical protein
MMKSLNTPSTRWYNPTLAIILFATTTILTTTNTRVNALQANSWQKRLDRAFLDVDSNSQARIRSLQRAIEDPNLIKDVSRAIDAVRTQGFGKGHPELIEILWPKGTIAREDLEGIQALTKQLPERFQELDSLESISELIGDVGGRLKVKDPSAFVSAKLDQVRDDPKKAVKLVQNVLRSKPAAIETLSYSVVRKIGGTGNETSIVSDGTAELRKYGAFQSISCPLDSDDFSLKTMGAGLNELSSYLLLGNNEESIIMSMTTPFIITKGVEYPSKMSLMLPKEFADSPPTPEMSSEIKVELCPETVVATVSFSGICTDQEIERQVVKLMGIIENDETLQIKSDSVEPEIMVMQYNAPGTVPWRRRNDISIVVEVQHIKDENINIGAEVEAVDENIVVSDTAQKIDTIVDEVSPTEMADSVADIVAVEEVDAAVEEPVATEEADSSTNEVGAVEEPDTTAEKTDIDVDDSTN